jgi:hypothetical protein
MTLVSFLTRLCGMMNITVSRKLEVYFNGNRLVP